MAPAGNLIDVEMLESRSFVVIVIHDAVMIRLPQASYQFSKMVLDVVILQQCWPPPPPPAERRPGGPRDRADPPGPIIRGA